MVRKMGEFQVTQRTKDSMFNATELLKQWNQKSGQQKKLDHFFENNSTKEFIDAIVSEENYNTRNSVYLKNRGKNGGTWMHPILFIDFAMWINPTFKLQVIKFVYDEMIKYRNDAGSAYVELSKSVQKLVSKDFIPKAMQKISEGINHVVFSSHEKGIRNLHGNEIKQKELFELEKKIADLINEGFIKSYEEVISYLRKQWNAKNNPKIFLNV